MVHPREVFRLVIIMASAAAIILMHNHPSNETTPSEADIKDSQKRAGELETKVGAVFEKEERYHFLVKRQAEIEDKLDLTKNQAPVQAEEISTDPNEENVSNQVIVKAKGEHKKKAGIRV